MADDRCDVCDSRGHVGACTGAPGTIYAPHSRNWFTVNEALLLERSGITVEWDTIWSYSRFGLAPHSERVVVTDCETTGLDPSLHQMFELAWYDRLRPWPSIQSVRLSHTLENAHPQALEVNNYHVRGMGNQRLWFPDHVPMGEILRATFEGAYVCGSNVAFDMGFIQARYGEMPWRHTPYEIGTAVMQYLGRRVPLRLHEIPEALGLDMTQNHTAAGDVDIVVSALLHMEANDGRTS